MCFLHGPPFPNWGRGRKEDTPLSWRGYWWSFTCSSARPQGYLPQMSEPLTQMDTVGLCCHHPLLLLSPFSGSRVGSSASWCNYGSCLHPVFPSLPRRTQVSRWAPCSQGSCPMRRSFLMRSSSRAVLLPQENARQGRRPATRDWAPVLSTICTSQRKELGSHGGAS